MRVVPDAAIEQPPVVDLGGVEPTVGEDEGGSRSFFSLIRGDRPLKWALGGIALLTLLVIVGPPLWHYSPDQISLSAQLKPPSFSHPMGTDDVGRDVFARFLVGGRTSLGAGFAVALISAVLGCIGALVSAFFHRGADIALSWATNSILAFPALMLAMAVAMALGPGVTAAIVALSLSCFPWCMRTLRAETMRINALTFIESSRAIGATRMRIMFRHVVPHLVPVILIQMAAIFGLSVLTFANLSFIGLGVQPPSAEWGTMITEGQQYFITGQWWIAGFPGLGLLVAVSLAAVVADRAREILDPRGEFVHAE